VHCPKSASHSTSDESDASTPVVSQQHSPHSLLVDCTNRGFRGDDDSTCEKGQINYAAQLSVESNPPTSEPR